jgi:hypothetical protein
MKHTMIQNGRHLNDFYRRLDAEENLSYQEALAIYEMLHKEAVSLGAISSENMLDGLEVDLRIAKAVNSVGV